MLAVLKAGAAYVPVDPSYPRERQSFILADAGVGVVVTQERSIADVEVPGAELLLLDRDQPRIDSRSDAELTGEADPEQLAYVIYTSGSTGKPKGVGVTHRAVANLMAQHARSTPGVDETTWSRLTTPVVRSLGSGLPAAATGAKLVDRAARGNARRASSARLLARGATIVRRPPDVADACRRRLDG